MTNSLIDTDSPEEPISRLGVLQTALRERRTLLKDMPATWASRERYLDEITTLESAIEHEQTNGECPHCKGAGELPQPPINFIPNLPEE